MPFTPIFLSSPGRSGSTLVMKVLSLHPQVLVRTVFPYETRAAQYFFIGHRLGHRRATFAPVTFAGPLYRPFHGQDKLSMAWSESQATTVLEPYGVNLTDAYYRFVARTENKPHAPYFAEKSIGFGILPEMARLFEDARVIFLKRDPRDTFFSYKAFDRKRGHRHFEEEGGDKATYARLMRYHTAARACAKTLGDRAVEVRYEALISEPASALPRFLEGLGLDCSDELLRRLLDAAFAENDEVKAHRTTRHNRASLRRWQSEADEADIALFETYNEVLEMLGYE